MDLNEIARKLSVLDGVVVHFVAGLGIWHASCQDVKLSDGAHLYSESACGPTPDEAVKAYWGKLINLPEGHSVVTNAWRADRTAYRWNPNTGEWAQVTQA